MINIIRANERYNAHMGWLNTHWHFSFADYRDDSNMNWGPLRVFNDDVVQPGKGFDEHPHRDMEIVSYVIDGQLRHRDLSGHEGITEPGGVQVMTAGRGIVHSEYNASYSDPVHFVQLWILPRTRGAEPSWRQMPYDISERTNTLLPVVSDGSIKGTLGIDQDATIYVSHVQAGHSVAHTAAEHRKAYLFVISGALTLNGEALGAGDQARIADETSLRIEATEDAELMLLDLPFDPA